MIRTEDYLSKKEALSDTQEEWKEELLTDLFAKIRNILTGEGEAQIKAKLRAAEK